MDDKLALSWGGGVNVVVSNILRGGGDSEQACGTAVESYASVDSGHGKKEGLILGVKDVSDMINFDDQQV